MWRLPAQCQNRESLSADPEEKSSSGQSLPMSSQSVFLFMEETHPENKPTCVTVEENYTNYVEISTHACILNFE